jgi:transcriptional regulator with XRE-family HTH domain
MNVSDNIRAIRKEKGLTQTEVAKRYGTSPEFYHRLEKKDKSLTIEQLERIATALDVSISAVLGIEDDKQSSRVRELERKNAEMKALLEEEVVELKEYQQKHQELVKQFHLFEELMNQQRENDKKIKIFAREILSTSNEKETQDKMLRFIKAFFLGEME